MKAVRALRFDPWLACAVLLALIPLQAILQPGMPHTADGQVHVLRTLETVRLLREGVLYPRWAPDFYLGYGYPFFNFYAPGAHLAAGLLALSGLGVVRGVVALQALALVCYPLGAYLAARAILPAGRRAGPAALLAAALYLYAPLRFRELFVQGNLSQWLALGLLPWCAWLLAGIARWGGIRRSIAGGLLLAALLYAHHPSAFLSWPGLLVYALALAGVAGRTGARGEADSRARAARLWRRVAPVLGSFSLAVAVGAPFWLPSVVELRDVNINAIATGSFNARLNLLPLSELLALPVLQDGAALNPPMPNSLGIVQALLAGAGVVVAAYWAAQRQGPLKALPGLAVEPARGAGWTTRQSGLTLLSVAALWVLSMALMLPVAAPIWESLPLARFIAFPWRLLGPTLLWSALLGSSLVYALPRRMEAPGFAILLILVLLGVAPYLFPRPFAPFAEPRLSDIVAYEQGGGALATASANEYLPRWVQDSRPPAILAEDYRAGRAPSRLDESSLPEGGQARIISTRGLEDRFQLDLPQAATVRVRRFYFPGWQASIDGRPSVVEASEPYGWLAIPVPVGRHELRVTFGNTPVRVTADVLALVGVLAALGLALRSSTGSRRGAVAAPAPASAYVPALLSGLLILSLALVKILLVGPHTTWFREQSPAASPVGMQHAVHATFANGVELLGYDLRQSETRQGETLGVRLYWRALQPRAANARPFLHLDAPAGNLTWANQTKLNAGDKPMEAWPEGFFVVDDYRLEVPPNTPPVVARLRAGLLAGQNELVSLANGGDLADLGTVRVREAIPLSAGRLPNHGRPYQVGPTVRLAGYDVRPAQDGQALVVTLYWQALAPVPVDYTVFVHVLGANGRTIAQQDGPPVTGWYPSSAWATGQIVLDRHLIALPAGIGVEDLQVSAGLYTAADGRRGVVSDAQGVRQPGDEVILRH